MTTRGPSGSTLRRSSAKPLSARLCRARWSILGLIPKGGQPGKFRLIIDLSSPHGASVNDGIDPELCSLSYSSVDEAVAQVRRCGIGALMAKLDLKSAYRRVPVHPAWDVLGGPYILRQSSPLQATLGPEALYGSGRWPLMGVKGSRTRCTTSMTSSFGPRQTLRTAPGPCLQPCRYATSSGSPWPPRKW